MGEIEDRAVRLKEGALLWVCIIRLSVTGTALFCGVVLSLMVRRRLYREVDATRLTG